LLDILQKILFEILCKFIRKIIEKYFFIDYSSVPEDSTRTSLILDSSTYQRLSHASRIKPKEAREHEIEESKRNRDLIEVCF